MRRILGVLLLSVSLVTVLAPTPAAAKKKKATPVTIDCGNPVGAIIDAPGRYKLTTAVTECAANLAIQITASDVSLDLGGLLIDGQDNVGSVGVTSPGQSRVRVSNGVVTDFSVGVSVDAESSVRGIAARSNAGAGIALGSDSLAKGNVVSRNGVGIDVGVENVITRNRIVGNGAVGAQAFGSGNELTRNRIIANGSHGVSLAGPGNIASRNIVSGNLAIGLEGLSSGISIVRNTVEGNQSFGIQVPSSAVVTGNSVIDNVKGISVSNGNLVAKNRVEGSTAPGINAGTANVISGNTVVGNDSFGIRTGGNGNTIVRNVARANALDGISMSLGDADTHIAHNVTIGNGWLGIDAGLFLGTGLGTNTARSNAAASPDECVPSSLCP